ncbi:MAG: ATP-binding protein [Gammaproteobacteria bacterium]
MVTVTLVTIIDQIINGTASMHFYNRQEELKTLNHLEKQASSTGVMTVLTGRRRVGKTMLALNHINNINHDFLYLFVGRKEETLLCQEFLEEIKKKFNIPIIGEIKFFKELFALLLEIAKNKKITIVIDEFQEFLQINKTVYSDLQKLWDLNKSSTKLHVIFIGSIYSLMHTIFEEYKQPLFGRADRIFNIKPFSLETLAIILKDYKIFTPENFFNFYVITGNMPKYLDHLLQYKSNTLNNLENLLNIILQKDSIFLNEGKNLLIEEFGRDYLTYFTILELISRGKTARAEIESLLSKDIGGYLQRLEIDYAIITKHRPINAKPNSKNQKYKIIDNFLNFWFRFIYHYRTAIELENFNFIKTMIKQDYTNYAGRILEHFFKQLLAETSQFNQIGSYWEKHNNNEIDIVAINDLEKTILIAETKLNKSKISLNKLAIKAQNLLLDYPGYKAKFLALSIEDVVNYI